VKDESKKGFEKKIHLSFFQSPIEMVGSSRLEGVRFQRMQLNGPAGAQNAEPLPGETNVIVSIVNHIYIF